MPVQGKGIAVYQIRMVEAHCEQRRCLPRSQWASTTLIWNKHHLALNRHHRRCNLQHSRETA